MYKKIFTRHQLILAGLDFILLNTLVFSVYWGFENTSKIVSMSYFEFLALVNVSWATLSLGGKLYSEYYISSIEAFSRKSLQIYICWLLIISIGLYFFSAIKLSGFFIIMVFILFGLMLLGTRVLYSFFYRYIKTKNHLIKKILILGYNNKSKKIIQYLEGNILSPTILGFCEDPKNVTELTHYPILSGLDGAFKTSIDLNVNEIYSTISPEDDPRIYKLMEQADMECIRFKIFPDASQYINYPARLSYLKDLPVLTMRKEPLSKLSNRVVKRLVDVFISLLVIIFILSWLLPVLGLMIFIESRGPILFVQYRSGRNKTPFSCLKLRSMFVNRESDTHQATKDDARFTKVGKFIRHTSLDEFPQFINVLLGNMSLVGPRPHMLKHTEDFGKMVNKYSVRHFVKPGITGWAQIKSYRGEITELGQVEERTQHDIWYLENWTLWLDIKILFLTVINKIKGEKDAF